MSRYWYSGGTARHSHVAAHGHVDTARCIELRQESDEAIIVGVTSDPVSDDTIFLHYRQGTAAEPDASRVYVVFAFEFLELQTGVAGIALEKTIGALGVPLNFGGQVVQQTPELPGGPR